MLRIYNQAAIKQRGGELCGNDDFRLGKCDRCGCQYLYEAEIGRIFFAPSDLTRFFHDFVGEVRPPCRDCGAKDWNYVELEEGDSAKAMSGEWGWLLHDGAIPLEPEGSSD